MKNAPIQTTNRSALDSPNFTRAANARKPFGDQLKDAPARAVIGRLPITLADWHIRKLTEANHV